MLEPLSVGFRDRVQLGHRRPGLPDGGDHPALVQHDHARKGNPTWTWAGAGILFIVIMWLSTGPKVLTGEKAGLGHGRPLSPRRRLSRGEGNDHRPLFDVPRRRAGLSGHPGRPRACGWKAKSRSPRTPARSISRPGRATRCRPATSRRSSRRSGGAKSSTGIVPQSPVEVRRRLKAR